MNGTDTDDDRGSAASGDDRPDREAQRLVEEGSSLIGRGESEQAIATLGRAVIRFRASVDPYLRLVVSWALVNRGEALAQLGRSTEALADFSEAAGRLLDGGNVDPVTLDAGPRELLARSLYGRGFALHTLWRHREGIAVYDDLVATLGADEEPAVRAQVARALNSKGLTLGRLGRNAEATAAFEEVIDRWADRAGPDFVELARAYWGKARLLAASGESSQAVAFYDELIARFTGGAGARVRAIVALAATYRAVELAKLGRTAEALAGLDEVITAPRDAPDAELRWAVLQALLQKATLLDQLGRAGEALSAEDEARSRFGQDDDLAVLKLLDGGAGARHGNVGAADDHPG